MGDCFFCKLSAHKIESEDVFFEDEKMYAMLDIDWAVKGHSLVVWKEHALNMSDLSEDDFLHFSKICRRVEKKLLRVLDADKAIILKSGGLESHFHFHIYPVKSDIPWNKVVDMFEKKTGYEPNPGEKEDLIATLKD